MTNGYDYLKKYNCNEYQEKIVDIGFNNIFYEMSISDIEENEIKMGEKFPSELRDFYLEIGFGHLTTPKNPKKTYLSYASNEILPSNIAVDYLQGILEHPDDDYYMTKMFYDCMESGDLPFFEIADSSRFLIMKLHSDNPNAVWALGDIKIEDSFEKFIWRLYYESPYFYDDIIE